MRHCTLSPALKLDIATQATGAIIAYDRHVPHLQYFYTKDTCMSSRLKSRVTQLNEMLSS